MMVSNAAPRATSRELMAGDSHRLLATSRASSPNQSISASRGSQQVLSSVIILYGISMTMLGVVIPVSDGLASATLRHQTYDQLFYLYMHFAGLIFLAFISIVIFRFKDVRPLYAGLEEAIPLNTLSREADLAAPIGNTNHCSSSSQLQLPASVDHLATDRVTIEHSADQSIDQSVDHTCEHSRHRQGDERGEGDRGSQADGVWAHSRTSGTANRGNKKSSGQSKADKKRRKSAANRGPTGPAVWVSIEGINLYLRLGAIIFGFGVMIHDAFKLADTLEQPPSADCRSLMWQLQLLVHLLFILLQTFHLFKNHRIVVTVYPGAIRFALAHLIVTNLCIWMKAVIYEVKMALSVSLDGPPVGNVSGNWGTWNYTNYQRECAITLAAYAGSSHALSPFLYPCAVEYGLISAAMCFKLFKKVGAACTEQLSIASVHRRQQHAVRSFKLFTTCHKSHKGLFFGLLIVILIVVPLATLVLLPKPDQNRRDAYTIAVLIAECSVLLITTAMCCAGACRSLSSLSVDAGRGGRDELDGKLLLVGLSGVLCYNLFVVVSSASCLMDEHSFQKGSDHCLMGTGKGAIVTNINGLKSLLDGAQALAQTFLIAQFSRRKLSRRLYLQGRKPARGILIALLVANLAMWVAAIFESKRRISVNFYEHYFGPKAWKIIKYTTLPMIIFFRFHSTVCLSEIWKNAYCHKEQLIECPI